MITKSRIYLNTARYFLTEKLRDHSYQLPVIGPSKVESVDVEHFDEVLSTFEDDVVFVHVGLSDVNRALPGDPYEFLMEKLNDHFDSVLAPGFTPSFRSSGIYHKEFSQPEYGTFAKLFLDDADYRTDDAIHSILVKGDYRFDECDHHDSFSEDGCWGKLDEDNILYLNIGTPWIIATQHHYIESVNDLPYVRHEQYEGIIYTDEVDYKSIVQMNYSYTLPVKRSAQKIEQYLVSSGNLTRYDINGLKVMGFHAKDIRITLESKLESNPYYLVS